MRLRWTTPAANDLFHIVQHIRRDNPDAAAKVAKVIYEGCERLVNFPRLGRNGRQPGTRELVFPPLPYIVVYKVQDQFVEVVRVYHGAQDWR